MVVQTARLEEFRRRRLARSKTSIRLIQEGVLSLVSGNPVRVNGASEPAVDVIRTEQMPPFASYAFFGHRARSTFVAYFKQVVLNMHYKCAGSNKALDTTVGEDGCIVNSSTACDTLSLVNTVTLISLASTERRHVIRDTIRVTRDTGYVIRNTRSVIRDVCFELMTERTAFRKQARQGTEISGIQSRKQAKRCGGSDIVVLTLFSGLALSGWSTYKAKTALDG